MALADESVLHIADAVSGRRWKLHVRGDVRGLRVAAIKRLLESQTGVPPTSMALTLAGAELPDAMTAEAAGIVPGSVIEMTPRGGSPLPARPPLSPGGPPRCELRPADMSPEDSLRVAFADDVNAHNVEIDKLSIHLSELRSRIAAGHQRLGELSDEARQVRDDLAGTEAEEARTAERLDACVAARTRLMAEIEARRQQEQALLRQEKERQDAMLADVEAQRREVSWRRAELERMVRNESLGLAAVERDLEATQHKVIDESRDTDRRQAALDALGPINPRGAGLGSPHSSPPAYVPAPLPGALGASPIARLSPEWSPRTWRAGPPPRAELSPVPPPPSVRVGGGPPPMPPSPRRPFR